MGNTPLEQLPVHAFAKATGFQGLSILAAGPQINTISNLLYSDRLTVLVKRLREDFDVILIDTPPMSLIADARVIGHLADAVILVVRAGQTTRDQALAAKDRLTADNTRVLGTILNAWDPKSKTQYAYAMYYDSYQ